MSNLNCHGEFPPQPKDQTSDPWISNPMLCLTDQADKDIPIENVSMTTICFKI